MPPKPRSKALCAAVALGAAGLWIDIASVSLSAAPAKQVREPIPRLWTPVAISTDEHESTPTFTPDGRSMFFVRADRNFAKAQIMQSHCKSGGWSKGALAPFARPLPAVESDPFLTRDGRRLFFISSRKWPSDPADGDFDIYSVARLRNGSWGEPQRLPKPVNSDGAEFFPRMDRRGNLYFRSDRPGGLGLGDIYVAAQERSGGWTVRNLGAPVNTPGDEVEAEISQDGRRMIVTADRPQPAHLYRYELRSGRWAEAGRVPARNDVYQVGPLLSPKGDRLLFAQKVGDRSGEIFLTDLMPHADKSWPPKCE